jgi:hypothetical protein
MSLFKLSDLTPPPAPEQAPGPDLAKTMQPRVRRQKLGPASFAMCPSRPVLKKAIGELEPGSCYVYLTGGKWSNHHLLQYLLEKTGPADVVLTTWTITEEPVRVMGRLLQEGTIRSLTMLTDDRIRSRCAQAWQLMQTLPATVHLSKCHAKVTVVTNEQHGFLVVSSQNFTNNPRIESGTIFYDQDMARFAQAGILEEVTNHHLVQ